MRPSGTSMMILAGWACVFWAVVSADNEPEVYKKVGDVVILKPGGASVSDPITNIIWKDGPNLAMQWDGTDADSYRHFLERGSLDTSTGEMTITGLIRNDSGLYTAEISRGDKVVSSSTRLIVISAVPTPTVMKSCDSEVTSCVLTCDGVTTDAEPVTYKWKSGATELADSSKEKRITKDDSSSVMEFSCELQNPVSQESSQPMPNPFITAPPEDSAEGGLKISTGLTVFISLVAAVLLLVLVHRWKAGMWFFQKESMPWESGFWSSNDRPPRDAAESNGTTARRDKEQEDEESPMT